jgi:hypothetical protein
MRFNQAMRGTADRFETRFMVERVLLRVKARALASAVPRALFTLGR